MSILRGGSRVLAAALFATTVAGTSGCGEVRLVDPRATGVPVTGAFFRVRAVDGRTDARLEFQGYAYGYERIDGRLYLRYLDAGRVAVAGREATRRYVRAGEPEYVLDELIANVPPTVGITVRGSDIVDRCRTRLVFPRAVLPDGDRAVARSEDLLLPLPALPDSMPGTDRVMASVSIRPEAGGAAHRTVISFVEPPEGPALVVPSGFLSWLAPGPAELSLRVSWERYSHDDAVDPACAPSQLTRATFETTRSIRLR